MISRSIVAAAALGIVSPLAIGAGVAAGSAPFGTHPAIASHSAPWALPTQRTITRKCPGKRWAAARAKTIRTRRTTTSTAGADRITRVVTTYCNGRRITNLTRLRSFAAASPPTSGPGAGTPGPSAGSSGAPFRLTLLHNNDGESKLRTGDSIPNYGGAARFAAKLAEVRAAAEGFTDADITAGRKKQGVVVVSSGDNILPGITARAALAAGRSYDAYALSRIGYDAITLGNHDFDFGPARLAQMIDDTTDRNATWISANIDISASAPLQALATAGRLRPYRVVERQGEKVGIIGLTTDLLPVISSPAPVTVRSNLAEIVNGAVRELEGQGVNKIVLSSHLQGLSSERALVPQLRGVDIVIAGGGDELLAPAGTPLVNSDPIAGPYPTMATDAAGVAVPIVTTQGEYRYVGRLVAEFDAGGRITSYDTARSGPIRVSGRTGDADIIAGDSRLVAEIDTPLAAYAVALAADTRAQSEVRLDARRDNPIRTREANLGNLTTDAFLYVGRRDAQARSLPLPDIAIVNGGGIRWSANRPVCSTTVGPGSAWAFSMKDVFDALPFDNLIVRVPGVTPAKLKALLEHAYGSLPSGNGKFAQVGGMVVTIDTSQPAGSRVQQVDVINRSTGALVATVIQGGTVVAGQASRQMVLMTTDFTANGGDAYPFAANGLTGQFLAPSVAYADALDRFVSENQDIALNGVIPETVTGSAGTAADYRFGAETRILIAGDIAYPTCS
jgi:5'-nucleotidase